MAFKRRMRSCGSSLLFVIMAVCLLVEYAQAFSGTEKKDFEYYFKVGDWKNAAASFDAEMRGNPQPEQLSKLAEAYYSLGKLDAAADAAQKALSIRDSIDPRITLLLIRARKGEKDQVLQELEVLSRDKVHGHKALTALGLIKVREDDEEALAYFVKAVALNPDDFHAWFQMGLIHEEAEQFEAASRAYKNAVRINPFHAQAQNNLGYSYKERHFYAYAIDHYLKAIELRPDNPGYYYNVGNAYTHEEMIDKAFEAYKKAVELEPTFAKAHYNLGRTYLRKNRMKEAVEEFKLYLKFGNKAVFREVAPPERVEEEIEKLETKIQRVAPRGDFETGEMAR